ncbi:serine/threonine protein phosphatase PrpC [Peribacillus deserti]|uniref:Serine/threonine protein phosphatase PrpC n=1 Tax=Peribacillus deserti TaxID=673318 RepID=A0ABS2QJ74_9BACI|nr:protein phosphatase 2C domain-containing protein [Peribacillus deserti]MBM7693202.1 serine/threonine protein phosphatase PrpC [Peribacillus deserti]
MPDIQIKSFRWVGNEAQFLDQPDVIEYEGILIGRYGGNSVAGGRKNEDGCLVWCSAEGDWEFSAILDGHNSAESVQLVLRTLWQRKELIFDALSQPLSKCFNILETTILEIFQNPELLQACRAVQGETNCLLTARKGKFLWWFSIGDNLLYLFHEELAAFGQYELIQRSFYEWVGYVNTFELEVPCYSTGRKELRKGVNQILLATDGLVECPGKPYQNPKSVKAAFSRHSSLKEGMQELLNTVHQNQGTDSSTIVSWIVDIDKAASYASDQFKKKSVSS